MGWSEAYKIFVFWRSHDGILFIVLCILWCCCVFSGAVVLSLVLLCCLWCCVVLSLLSALEMFEVPGHRGDTPPGGLHFCRKGVWRVGRDVFNSHDTGKI